MDKRKHAWKLVEELRESGLYLAYDKDEKGVWTVSFFDANGEIVVSADGHTFPDAVFVAERLL